MKTKSDIIKKFIYLNEVDENELNQQDKVDYGLYKNISKEDKINYLYNRGKKYQNISLILFFLFTIFSIFSTKSMIVNNLEWIIVINVLITGVFLFLSIYFVYKKIKEKEKEKIQKLILEKLVLDKVRLKMDKEEEEFWRLLCEDNEIARLEYLLKIEEKYKEI